MNLKRIILLICFVFVSHGLLITNTYSVIIVPDGLFADKIYEQTSGSKKRIEAIRNYVYGEGVMAAAMDGGVVTVHRIDDYSNEVIASFQAASSVGRVGTIRFDTTGIFGNDLFLSLLLNDDLSGAIDSTDLVKISSGGEASIVGELGSVADKVMALFDFSDGTSGYDVGAYLVDIQNPGGTSLYFMDSTYAMIELANDLLPSGRTDIDMSGIEFDKTGLYGNFLTDADTDANSDGITVIIQLTPELVWEELSEPVSPSSMYYWDIAFSSGGAIAQALYITDAVSDSVMKVDPNGVHSEFATGFNGIYSLTISDDGEHMYVSDSDGVYHIHLIESVDVTLNCSPTTGTLPFLLRLGVIFDNLADNYRTFAGRIDVTLASGGLFTNYRAGYTNLLPSEHWEVYWHQNLPNYGTIVGENAFLLTVMDVTPSPYNQPPFWPSGDTDTDACTVTGIAP